MPPPKSVSASLSLKPADEKRLEGLTGLFAAFRDLDPKLTFNVVAVFFQIAWADQRRRMVTMRDLENQTGMDQSTLSRVVKTLSHDRNGMGLKLVSTEQDPREYRARILHLTPKGSDLVEKLLGRF